MMQHDPTKMNLNYPSNIYTNQYPPVNQQQFGTGNIYQYYIPYPSQSIAGTGYTAPNVQYYGQASIYPQSNVIVAPATYRLFGMNQIFTTITPNLRTFLIISGVIYTIWSLAIIGLEVAITVESHWSFYRSVWASGFILGGGICMLVVACRTNYPMITLIRIFASALLFCSLGITLSAVNYSTSTKCSEWYSSLYSCDNELVSNLKVISLVVFIVATIHTVINLVVIGKEQKKTSLNLTVPNH